MDESCNVIFILATWIFKCFWKKILENLNYSNIFLNLKIRKVFFLITSFAVSKAYENLMNKNNIFEEKFEKKYHLW